MSHSQKPRMPSQPDSPSTPAVAVAQKLDQILHAILPLHDLLAAQEKSDKTLTDRLSEVMLELDAIAGHLNQSAEALEQLTQAERLPLAHQTAFDHLSARLDQMEKHLNTLSNWLGAPIHISAELTSSATS